MKKHAQCPAGLALHQFSHGSDIVRRHEPITAAQRSRMRGIIDQGGDDIAVCRGHPPDDKRIIDFAIRIQATDYLAGFRQNQVAVIGQAAMARSPTQRCRSRGGAGPGHDLPASSQDLLPIRDDQVASRGCRAGGVRERRTMAVGNLQDQRTCCSAEFRFQRQAYAFLIFRG